MLLLRVLAVVDGRNRQQIASITGISMATLTRYLGIARRFGCKIRYNQIAGVYELRDSGVFDLQRVRTM